MGFLGTTEAVEEFEMVEMSALTMGLMIWYLCMFRLGNHFYPLKMGGGGGVCCHVQYIGFSKDVRNSLRTLMGRRPELCYYFKVFNLDKLDQTQMLAARQQVRF